MEIIILILLLVLIASLFLCGIRYKDESLLERRAKWVNIGHNGTYECSWCGRKSSKSDYCPYCGSIMEGEIND